MRIFCNLITFFLKKFFITWKYDSSFLKQMNSFGKKVPCSAHSQSVNVTHFFCCALHLLILLMIKYIWAIEWRCLEFFSWNRNFFRNYSSGRSENCCSTKKYPFWPVVDLSSGANVFIWNFFVILLMLKEF